MKKDKYVILENQSLTAEVWRMRLMGDSSAITRPGQFVNIALDSFYLRRPISVCDWDEDGFTILYKILGHGTAAMKALEPGTSLDILTGLGNGFSTEQSGERPLLIGGGVGIPPLFGLAKRLLAEGKTPLAILGFRTAKEAFFTAEFAALGVKTLLATEDGTLGQKGFVTDALLTHGGYSYFYACGPQPMLKEVAAATSTSGQLSFEERMGCGFGACMGCSCQTKSGSKRICKEGPVLVKEDILW